MGEMGKSKEILKYFEPSDTSVRVSTISEADFIAEYHIKMRKEQISRTTVITEILENYKKQQERRCKYKENKKKEIFSLLEFIVAVLTIGIVIGLYVLFSNNENNEQIVAIIASLVGYFSTITSIFMIIVKYIFPENEEKGFNDLVSTIIENDTSRMKHENDYEINKRK